MLILRKEEAKSKETFRCFNVKWNYTELKLIDLNHPGKSLRNGGLA